MRALTCLSIFCLSCATTPPVPEEAASDAPAPVEPPAAAPAPRVAPDLASELEGLEGTQVVDVDTGWLAFGIDRESGAIRAVWSDGEQVRRREQFVVQPDLSCDQNLNSWAERMGPFVLVWVECQGGEDTLWTETTTYVLTKFDDFDTLAVAWSGLTVSEESNQVTGCSEGNNASLEVRGEELWLVTAPWAERLEGYEEDAEELGACDGPEPREERKLLPQ